MSFVENKKEEFEERISNVFLLIYHMYIYKRVRLYNR